MSWGSQARTAPAERSLPPLGFPKFLKRIVTECNRTSRQNDQLLIPSTSRECKSLTALRSSPDLTSSQLSAEGRGYHFTSIKLNVHPSSSGRKIDFVHIRNVLSALDQTRHRGLQHYRRGSRLLGKVCLLVALNNGSENLSNTGRQSHRQCTPKYYSACGAYNVCAARLGSNRAEKREKA